MAQMLANAGSVLSRAKKLQQRWETRDIDPGYSMREFRQDITLVAETVEILTELNGLLENTPSSNAQHDDILSKAMFFVGKLKSKDVKEKEMTTNNKSSLMDSILGFMKNTNNDEVKRQLSSDIDNFKNVEKSNYQNTNYPPSSNYQNTNPNDQNPCFQNSNSQNPNYQNPNYQNPNYQNPSYQNSNYQTPNQNSNYQTPNQNTNFQNPSFQNPNYQNSNLQNPNLQNPNYQNPNFQDPNQQNQRNW